MSSQVAPEPHGQVGEHNIHGGAMLKITIFHEEFSKTSEHQNLLSIPQK